MQRRLRPTGRFVILLLVALAAVCSVAAFSENSANSTFLPTGIYGQLLNASGNPMPGATVVAEWIDGKGAAHAVQTRTLTAEEAKSAGNASLLGSYFFTRGEIAVPLYTVITLKHDGRLLGAVEAQPGTYLEVRPALPVPAAEEETKPIPVSKPSGKERLAAMLSAISRFLPKVKLASWYLISLASAIASYPRSYLPYLPFVLAPALGLALVVRALAPKKTRRVSDCMSRDVVTITPGWKVKDLIELFISQDVSAVVIARGRHSLGVVTRHAILERLAAGGRLATMTLAEVTSHPRSVGQRTPVLRAASLSLTHHAAAMPVTRLWRLKGIVSRRDILSELDKMLSLKNIPSIKIPLVREIKRSNFLILTADQSLSTAMRQMTQKKTEIIMVLDAGPNRLRVMTDLDLLRQFHYHGDATKDVRLGDIVGKELVALIPRMDVIQANKAMLDAGAGKVPVIDEGRVEGIVTSEDILRALMPLVKQ